MIKQVFNVEGYWKVVVYYSMDYHFFDIVAEELHDIGLSWENIDDLYSTMSSGKAKAVTCSSLHHHISILLFNSHKTKADYIDSIVHEAEHVKQAMLYAYAVEDSGEPPAYTIGYLISRMYEVFQHLICDCR